jgi:hypothetical protein
MDIIIKNVTGRNDGYIWELQREGYPEGIIVRDALFDQSNQSCSFGHNHNCVAYLGETCEEWKDGK